ncbi:hypothetical protein [Catenuloplanes atrovinosus]|uniref:Uncharacterized protein n=1 Tax=Catenuloplanes atrovinosus TaxID=137266 RepID=A0AAE3YP41_9ACTN|nr:hypothetical protein [Catenuloplanes atrovinosus]MDR7275971.1 hypothetical protein [Catenuloplanes atrovinosus]
MSCSACGSPRPADAAVLCANCGARFPSRGPGRFTPLATQRGGSFAGQAGGGSVTVLDGIVVPPSRQNGPVDREPEPQPLLISTPAPASTPPAATPALRWRDLFSGAWHGAAVTVTAGAVLTAVFATAAATLLRGSDSDLAGWLTAAVTLIGLALGGSLSAGADLLPGVAVVADLRLQVLPVLLTVAIAGPLAGLAIRDERLRPSPVRGALLARTAITAGTVTALVTGAGVLNAVQSVDGRVTAGLAPLPTAVPVFALVIAVTVAARLTVTPAVAPRSLRPLADAAALLGRFTVALLLGTAVVGVVLAATGSHWAVLGGLVALPSALLVLLGVPVTVSVPSMVEVVDGLTLVTRPSWWSLLLLVPAVAALVAAVRHALARPVGARTSAAATIGLTAASVTLLAVAGRVTAEITFASVEAGPSLLGAVIAGLVWGGLLAASARVAPDLALLFRSAAETMPVHDSWRAVFFGTARVRTGVIVATAAALVVPALALTGIVVVNRSEFGPDRVALAYLRAVSRGDAAAAMAERTGTASGPLLTDAVLRATGVTRPDDVRIVSTVVDGARAQVATSFTLGGEEQLLTLTLASEERRYGLFDRWRVVSELGAVSVTDAGMPVTVAGVTVSAGRMLPAFPARYPLAVADPSDTYRATRTTVVVLGGTAEVAAEPVLSASARDRITDALEAGLSACTARTDPFMTDCPFDLAGTQLVMVDRVTYDLRRPPHVDLHGSEVVTTSSGTVDYRASMLDGTERTGTIEFNVTGSATFADDGTVTLTLG